MTGKRWLVAAGVAVLLVGTGSGCVTCCHTTCKPAQEAGPTCELPLGNRQRTYAVLVNGAIPDCGYGLTGLRDKLAGQGFPKVYHGYACHGPWLAHEMRRVHKDEPGARFVVVGYDLGGPVAGRLARDAADAGIPVDALVLLDPSGDSDAIDRRVPMTIVMSGAGGGVPHPGETIVLPDAGHFTLPTHAAVVSLVCDLMTDTAGRIPTPGPVPVTEWSYEFAPPPWSTPMPGPNDDPAWHFLLDLPGPKTPPLVPPDAPPVPGPGPLVPVPRQP